MPTNDATVGTGTTVGTDTNVNTGTSVSLFNIIPKKRIVDEYLQNTDSVISTSYNDPAYYTTYNTEYKRRVAIVNDNPLSMFNDDPSLSDLIKPYADIGVDIDDTNSIKYSGSLNDLIVLDNPLDNRFWGSQCNVSIIDNQLSITDTDGNNPAIESLEPNKIYYFLIDSNVDTVRTSNVKLTFTGLNDTDKWEYEADGDEMYDFIEPELDNWKYHQMDVFKQKPMVYYGFTHDGKSYIRVITPSSFMGTFDTKLMISVDVSNDKKSKTLNVVYNYRSLRDNDDLLFNTTKWGGNWLVDTTNSLEIYDQDANEGATGSQSTKTYINTTVLGNNKIYYFELVNELASNTNANSNINIEFKYGNDSFSEKFDGDNFNKTLVSQNWTTRGNDSTKQFPEIFFGFFDLYTEGGSSLRRFVRVITPSSFEGTNFKFSLITNEIEASSENVMIGVTADKEITAVKNVLPKKFIMSTQDSTLIEIYNKYIQIGVANNTDASILASYYGQQDKLLSLDVDLENREFWGSQCNVSIIDNELSITDTDGNNPAIESLESNKIYYFLIDSNIDTTSNVKLTFTGLNGTEKWEYEADGYEMYGFIEPTVWAYRKTDSFQQKPLVYYGFFNNEDGSSSPYFRVIMPSKENDIYMGSYLTVSLKDSTKSYSMPIKNDVAVEMEDHNQQSWIVDINESDEIVITDLDNDPLTGLIPGYMNYFIFKKEVELFELDIIGPSGETIEFLYDFYKKDRQPGFLYKPGNWGNDLEGGPIVIYHEYTKVGSNNQSSTIYSIRMKTPTFNPANIDNGSYTKLTYLVFNIPQSNNNNFYKFQVNNATTNAVPISGDNPSKATSNIIKASTNQNSGSQKASSGKDLYLSQKQSVAAEKLLNSTDNKFISRNIDGKDITYEKIIDPDDGTTRYEVTFNVDDNVKRLYELCHLNFQATSEIRLEVVRLLEKILIGCADIYDDITAEVNNAIIGLYASIYTDMTKLLGSTGDYNTFIKEATEADKNGIYELDNSDDFVGSYASTNDAYKTYIKNGVKRVIRNENNDIIDGIYAVSNTVKTGLYNFERIFNLSKYTLLPAFMRRYNSNDYNGLLKIDFDELLNIARALVYGFMKNDLYFKGIFPELSTVTVSDATKVAIQDIGIGLTVSFFEAIVATEKDSNGNVTITPRTNTLVPALSETEDITFNVDKYNDMRSSINSKMTTFDSSKIGNKKTINDEQYVYDITRLKADTQDFNFDRIIKSASISTEKYLITMLPYYSVSTDFSYIDDLKTIMLESDPSLNMLSYDVGNGDENNGDDTIIGEVLKLHKSKSLPSMIIMPGTYVRLTQDGKEFWLLVWGYGSIKTFTTGLTQSEINTLSSIAGAQNKVFAVYVHDTFGVNIQTNDNTLTPALQQQILAAKAFVSSIICFPAGTPITTDQGNIAIEKLQSSTYTIGNEKIVAITKTVTLDKQLVLIKENAMGMGVPNMDTYLSKEHKVFFNGRMISAKYLTSICKNVVYVAYNNEILYNVLMEKYGGMMVNNILCETLDPNGPVAELFRLANTNINEYNSLVMQLNMAIANKDAELYNSVVKKLTTDRNIMQSLKREGTRKMILTSSRSETNKTKSRNYIMKNSK